MQVVDKYIVKKRTEMLPLVKSTSLNKSNVYSIVSAGIEAVRYVIKLIEITTIFSLVCSLSQCSYGGTNTFFVTTQNFRRSKDSICYQIVLTFTFKMHILV